MTFLAAIVAAPVAAKAAEPTVLMPAPADAKYRDGRFAITEKLSVSLTGAAADDMRLQAAVARLLTCWQERTGFTFPHTKVGAFDLATAAAPGQLTIACERGLPALPALGDDESYMLEVSPIGAALRAPTGTGVLRGLSTLQQFLQADAAGWFLPAASIHDRPRFPWRGLLIDVCRHWEPIDVIKRNLDGMALAKLNVLHLHLTEDQGFRIESKTEPRLHELGSDGHYFTQDQIRDIIGYAADRGIRVVPEFDMPGHATSWVVAFPELAGAPGPYVIERHWGVFNPVLDPTNEQTYAMLERFLGEMAALFPDAYLHIGGDENNGVQWNANQRIQAFIREHNLKDNAGLHAFFNRRIRDILQRHGKKLVGWDEILHPDLPKDSVIQSWRGPTGLAAAASQGYATILSNGYYIDLCASAADHYRNDPVPTDTTLTSAEQQHVLGGEATMWGEWVTPETIDSRIWPRTAAIAERLWSPRGVNDVPDMYRRLAIVSRRLEEAGLRHEKNRPEMIRRYAGDVADPDLSEALAILADVVEPVKGYERAVQQPATTQLSPLTGLVDIARPESDVARQFGEEVTEFLDLTATDRSTAAARAHARLVAWKQVGDYLQSRAADASPRVVAEARPVAAALGNIAAIGLEAFANLQAGAPADKAWHETAKATLKTNHAPGYAILIPVTDAVAKLVDAVPITSAASAP